MATMKLFLALVLAITFFYLAAGSVFAQGREELLYQEIPMVTTATKIAEPVNLVPVPVSVITQEEIERSGAINIPQLLRRLPGLDVTYDSVSQYDIIGRGFNQSLSPRMLVMIDGLSVYQDFYGMVTWDWLPITMDDIARIEVVRSPISSLYGPNAYSGVINIITKDPAQYKGGRVSGTGGSDDMFGASGLAFMQEDKLKNRISYGWQQMHKWDSDDSPLARSQRVNDLLTYMIRDDAQVSLNSMAVFRGNGQVANGALDRDVDYLSFENLVYKDPSWELQGYWKGADGKLTSAPNIYGMNYNVFGGKIQNTLAFANQNILISGIEYKQTTLDGGQDTLTDATHTNRDYSGYVQDEYKPFEKIVILSGLRVDKQELINTQYSPRASVGYSINKDHNLRLSFNQAFRSPSLYNNYYQQTFVDYGGGLTYDAVGNKDLKPEKVTSYEFGYRGQVQHLDISADLFRRDIKDFITFTQTEFFDFGGGVIVPTLATWENRGQATLDGAEVEFKYPFSEWARAVFNYSYQYLVDYKDNLTQVNAPKHKCNLGLDTHFKSGFFGSAWMHYVGPYTWEEDAGPQKIKPYTLTDVSLGYKFNRSNITALVSAWNVFDRKHIEQANISQDTDSEPVGRTIYGSLRYDW